MNDFILLENTYGNGKKDVLVTLMNMIFYFMIYSFGGWVCECIYCFYPKKHFVNRGFLRGPYCPIYGFGALLVVYLLRNFVDDPILIFLLGFF